MTRHYLSRVMRFALILCMLFTGLGFMSAAKTITVDGIKYKYSKNKDYLIVIKAAYTGDIVIPGIVSDLPVKEIGSSAFSELDELISVTLPNSVRTIGDYAFDSSSNLQTVNLGDSIKKIGHWAFRNCYELKDLKFPNTLKSIGNYCFDKNLCMTEVTFPENMTLIGGYAFEGNPQLKKVYSLSTTPPEIKKGYLDGEEIYTLFDDEDYGDRTLYVPEGTAEAYKLEFGWNHFKDIQEIVPTSIKDSATEREFKVFSTDAGELTVCTADAVEISITDLSGVLLARQKVEAGVSYFHVPGGIVIVNGRKVLVR